MATTMATTVESARPGGFALRRFGMMFKADALMYVREKSAVFWVMVFPILLMLLFGSIWGNQLLNEADPNSATFISYLTPGLIVLSLLSNGLIGNATTMSTYREKGILRRIQATPLPVWQLLLSSIIFQSLIMIMQAGVMLGVSVLVFNATYDFWGLAGAIPAVVFVAVTFMAMGTAVAALVSKTKTVEVVAQVINVPLMFLGGLWTPISFLPDWLGGIAKYLPTAMAADLVRAPMLSSLSINATNLPIIVSILGLALYLVAAIVIAARFFKWR
jgi:ABC-2 type transport system permease protein